jgi:hypothetical protein
MGLPTNAVYDKSHFEKVLRQVVIDILLTLDHVYKKYRSSVLDFAVWRRNGMEKERRQRGIPDLNTYSRFITIKTMHMIVHTNFIGPDVAWDPLGFDTI